MNVNVFFTIHIMHMNVNVFIFVLLSLNRFMKAFLLRSQLMLATYLFMFMYTNIPISING